MLHLFDYFELCSITKTRSNHQYKIQTKLAKLNCYKYSFFVEVIKYCNSVLSTVINCHDSPNINKFKLKIAIFFDKQLASGFSAYYISDCYFKIEELNRKLLAIFLVKLAFYALSGAWF